MDSMRLFYALWPDDKTRSALAAIQNRIHGRKVRSENLHLTLAFLGQQSADRLPVLKEILARLPFVAMPLLIDRVGYFARHRVAWAGMHHMPDALAELHQLLLPQLLHSSISFDAGTDFKPHITLARHADAPEDFSFDPVIWQADHIALLESTSDSRGAVYRVLSSRRAM